MNRNMQTSAPVAQPSYPGCTDALRLAFAHRDFPPVSWEFMLASLSKSTIQQYNITFKLWWNYCLLNKRDIFNTSTSFIMCFLTEQYNKGACHATLNNHRTALSMFLGSNISTSEAIKRLLKGVYKLRPNAPNCDFTWDPQLVLDHIAEWYPNTDLSLGKITKKLVVLLALCTAHRAQTLSSITVDNVSISLQGVRISLTSLMKPSVAGRPQPTLFLPFFEDRPNICPATVLKDYLTVTGDKRPENVNNLLISVKRPHKRAPAQSIKRWVMQALADSGVDVARFSRSATAATVNLDVVRKTVEWTSNTETFAKFYHRQVDDEHSFCE